MEKLKNRINWLQSILDKHNKKPFLSDNGRIIETVIYELKQVVKL